MAFRILLASFILVPILEIVLLIRVGSAIGVGSTILFVIFTAVLGAYLVRQQGFATLTAVQNEMNSGRVPALQMAEGVALLFAGAVLLTPGFFTDAIGFALLTPFIRKAVIAWAVKNSNFTMHAAGPQHPQQSAQKPTSILEGEFTDAE